MDASPYRIAPDDWTRLLTELGVDARSTAPRAASPRHARRLPLARLWFVHSGLAMSTVVLG
jgi:hypothetical protein